MDLELTDEQRWLGESIDTLLARAWPAPESVAGAAAEDRRRVWNELVGFGALAVGDEDGIGAVEACLIARALGSRLVSVPFIDNAAIRLALPGEGDLGSGTGVALGQAAAVTLRREDEGRYLLTAENVAVEQLDLADRLAVVAWSDGEPVLAIVPVNGPGISVEPRRSFDTTLPVSALSFDNVIVAHSAALAGPAAHAAISRMTSAGALLAAAEAVGAAQAILGAARDYAGERRQFGRSIGSFQALRHLLADMYVRAASGWSAVLYAAAAFDDGAGEAALAASVAKAYVSRGAREVAHGAMQVFGGIAFTEEHPAHRFLRRIVVRERQFGDAAHHERELGRALARRGRELAPRAHKPDLEAAPA